MHIASPETTAAGFDRLILLLCAEPNTLTLSIDRSPVLLTRGRAERLGVQLDTNRELKYLSACNMSFGIEEVAPPEMRLRTEFAVDGATCKVCQVSAGSFCGCDFEPSYEDKLCQIIRPASRMSTLVRLDLRVNMLSATEMRVLNRMIRHGNSLTTLGFSVANNYPEASRGLLESAKNAVNLRALDIHCYDQFDTLRSFDGCYKDTDRITLCGFVSTNLQHSVVMSIRRDIPFNGSRDTSLDVTAYSFESNDDNFFGLLLSTKQQPLSTLFYELYQRDTSKPIKEIPCMYTAQVTVLPLQSCPDNRLKLGPGNFTYPASTVIRKSVTDDRFRYVEFKHY